MDTLSSQRKYLTLLLVLLGTLAGCGEDDAIVPTTVIDEPMAQESTTHELLAVAREGFQTRIVRPMDSDEPIAEPPSDRLEVITYESPVGPQPAYVTPDPGDGRRHPAIVWITGGICNIIGDVWNGRSPENDQSAFAYGDQGVIMLFPSLRGGNQGGSGTQEAFYGEVDDVLAAADHLATLGYVDPDRIYLGGHSTGGTLSLLVAESSGRFRAVFAFGPVADIAHYGLDSGFILFDTNDPTEFELRAPVLWLDAIASPTFVIEGREGNLNSLETLRNANTNPLVTFLPVDGANHFNVLAPVNRFIAEKIRLDTGPTCQIAITQADLNQFFP